MKKSLIIEIGWILGALLLCVIQISIVMNWDSGRLFNLIVVTVAVLTLLSKKRAFEVALISGGVIDALSATPFGLSIIHYMLILVVLHVLTHHLFHTSVLYTVGLSTLIASTFGAALTESLSSLYLFQNLSLMTTERILTMLWQGLLHGGAVAAILWWWHHQPRVFKRSYEV